MAFNLVQYLNEQIQIQKPSLLNQYSTKLRSQYIQEINALTLGKLVILWRDNYQEQFHQLHFADETHTQAIINNLCHSVHNESSLPPPEFFIAVHEILNLQLAELRQLEITGQYGAIGLRVLIIGQVEHLTGQAEDWVWSTNKLIELKGSKPTVAEDISLEQSFKEFNQMVQQPHLHNEQPETTIIPTWARIIEPVVAFVILYFLFNALCNVFA